MEQAWYLADVLGAGSFPWVLAITAPYGEPAERDELLRRGVLGDDGEVNCSVAEWIRATCRPRRWLELRFVAGSGSMLRGHVALGDGHVVVALRSAQLVTFTVMAVDHPDDLVPVLTAGLARRPPANFDEFAIPARIGVKADERLRNGASLDDVVDYLGIPATAREVVAAAFSADRSYVEVVAGDHRDGHRVGTDVGVSVVDTARGRVLVTPSHAFDGEWVSTFTAGSDLAIAAAVERLTALLPDGPWFPHVHLTRDFDLRTEERQCLRH